MLQLEVEYGQALEDGEEEEDGEDRVPSCSPEGSLLPACWPGCVT